MANPTLSGIERVGSPATGAATAQFRLTFSEPVSGLTAESFSLDLTGSLAGAAVTAITPESGGARYLVTATTGTGEGELRIVFDPLGVTNAAGEPFANAAGLFRSGGSLTGNTTTYGVAIGDLDGDGDADLATADFADGTVSALLNDGTGHFAAAAHYGVPGMPLRASLADLDGDGRPEIVASPAFENTGQLAIAVNDGDGGFTMRNIAASSYGYGVAAADLDRDGDLDLLLPDNGAGSLGVLRNNGDGSFAAAVTYQVGPGVLSATTADVDGDGALDVVVPNNTGGSLSVLRNDGSGGLLPQVAYATGLEPRDVLAMDVDRDGDTDLVVASSDSGLQFLLNRGDGSFADGTAIALAGSAYRLAAGDIDADGRLDIVAATTQGVVVLRGTAGGSFAPPATFLDGNFIFDVALGDINGDRRLDIIAASGGATLSVLLNTATSFTSPAFAIDHVLPQGSAVINAGGDPDSVAVTYRVTFTEAVTGLTAASFALLTTGSVTGRIAAVTAAGDGYLVGVTGLLGFGTLGLDLVGPVADAAGNAVQWTAPALHEVDVDIPPEGGVAVAGIALRGSPLTVTSDLTDADGLGPLDYQWQREAAGLFTDIAGATGDSYTPGRGDIGHALRVVVDYQDGRGHGEQVTSAPTLAIAAATIPLATPAAGVSSNAGQRSIDIAARVEDGDLLVLPAGAVRLDLADGSVDYDGGSDAAFLGRLYQGLFRREGDALGLDFWSHRADGPLDRTLTTEAFAASPEYTARHGALAGAAFVASLYQDLLGHAPDPAGQAYFASLLANGTSRGEVAAIIADSTEARTLWQGQTAEGIFVPAEHAPQIRAAYITAFGREADAGGLVYFRGAIENGLGIDRFTDLLAGSPEFAALHGGQTDREFVVSLYRDALDRTARDDETGFYESRLASGAYDRGDVVAIFATAPEVLGGLDWPLLG